MGRSKPRTNKRPPPKPNRRAPPPAPVAPAFDPAAGLFPPPSTLDPSDPGFPSAFQSWSTSALNQLNQLRQLPALSPSQLSAIAGAAAGVSDAGFQGQGPCIDLPQSLAALFEAKLTLDREKAKLMRMQKELRGFRDGMAGPVPTQPPPPLPTVKGKEVAVDDELAECTCGRNGHTHEYPGSAHSGSDDYYYYDTEDECCDCCSHDHSYVESDPHGHGEEYYEPERGFEALVLGPDGRPANLTPEQAMALFERQPYLHSPEARAILARGHAQAAEVAAAKQKLVERPRRRLADDPERMDEAVRELFNWIKAVVWTIEQAAIVAGRRAPLRPQRRDVPE
ncbi:hypothetical protein CcaverHIS002_0409540 [Cutaneotrichosporon cavernicola]|nr:hypothetical protein CcaverHIS002_0409540 [Cutaneotrichosporon cavernicola]